MLLYRFLASALALPVILWLALRASFAPQHRAALRQRLGGGPPRLPGAPLVWLHGASNGEMTAARPLLAAMLARWPALAVAVTVNTPTARDLVTAWAEPRITVSLAPLDTRHSVDRFLDRTRPAALVVIENELWPLRLTMTAARGAPVIVASARMSERSARNWRRLATPAGITAAVLGAITRAFPQDAATGQRLAALGLDPARIGPVVNLKAATAPRATPDSLSLPLNRSDTILAASTHDGEEAVILDAFRDARVLRPDLRLILAPRHPRRRDAIETLLIARGLTFSTRSRGQEPDPRRAVYLADTMGEMPLWYAAASVTFVGGSLTDRGGHTPFEPAAFGSAILHGPDTANFAAAYAALAPDAARAVTGPADLARAMAELTGSPAAALMARHAASRLARLTAIVDLDPILGALAAVLDAPPA